MFMRFQAASFREKPLAGQENPSRGQLFSLSVRGSRMADSQGGYAGAVYQVKRRKGSGHDFEWNYLGV
jgi:hypothetical protein